MDAISNSIPNKIDPTEKETDLARKYLRGEYTEVQFNYLAHQCGSDRERMDRIVEKISCEAPLSMAAKFILICMIGHFLACAVYSLLCLQ